MAPVVVKLHDIDVSILVLLDDAYRRGFRNFPAMAN